MSLEPLADYLEPQFGNIYDYKLPAPRSVLEVQEWTEELRRAVWNYLVHEVGDDGYAAFLNEYRYVVPRGDRKAEAADIIKAAEAWEIANAFHLAAVKAVPTLDQFIGQLETWPDVNVRVDVAEWLDAHASVEQLYELAEATGHPERDTDAPSYSPEPIGEDFTCALSPSDLLAAWHHVVGPAPSDLTDDEWGLLVSSLPVWKNPHSIRARSSEELLSLRRTFDGIRYRFAQGAAWSKIPKRYGNWRNIYQRYRNHGRAELFARMYQLIQHQAGAERLVMWLEEMATKHDANSAE